MPLLLVVFFLSSIAFAGNPKDQWAGDYQKAQKLMETERWQSCQLFTKLSQQKKAALWKLAWIRTIDVCYVKNNPAWKQFHRDINEAWLYPALYKSKFQFFERKKKFVDAMVLYLSYGKYIKLDKEEKTSLLNKALKQKMSRRQRKRFQKILYKTSPRFIPRPQPRDYLSVAKDFRHARNFDKAITYYRKVINQKGFTVKQKWYGFKGARRTYKTRKWTQMEKYIRASKQWAYFLTKKYKRSKQFTKFHHNANIEYIRTLWTEQGQSQAYKELLRLEKELQGRYSLQLVYWLKGRMAEEKKNYKEAVKWLKRSSEQASLSPEDRRRVLWMLAWNQRRIGQFAESNKNLDKLNRGKDLKFFAKTKYLFWKAMNLEAMKEKGKAQKAFAELADFDLHGYYGPLAFRHLKKKLPAIRFKTFKSSDFEKMFKSRNDHQLFLRMKDIGEWDSAQSFIDNNISPKRRWPTEKWTKYLFLLQQSRNYLKFFERYHVGVPPNKQIEILKEYPNLLFPRPYPKLVEGASQKTNVPSALIYSIMKQESGFDPKARSFADAFGLLQLIPQVAEKSVKNMKEVPYRKAQDLFQPEINIPLGAQTLKQLRGHFKDQFVLTVGSYNATDTAVKSWVKTRYFGDPLTFIEDIPYEETKGYIKLVMRNFIAYNRFEKKNKSVAFPEHCLQGLQAFKH